MAGQRHYCTYFDHRYLPRGLAMIRSLRRFEPDAVIWVLCLSEFAEQALTSLAEPNVRSIGLAAFVSDDPALQAARANRSLLEFYFTCTPSIVRYVLERTAPEDVVTYVDGDLYFFSSPEPLYDELGEGSVSIISHRFSDAQRAMENVGIYNVGWLSFRNDVRGRAVANWWRDRCNEWCYDVFEEDRFLDQKYLDRFPRLFEGVVVLENPGANLAPWNTGTHDLTLCDDALHVDNAPLIFFHFHALKSLGRSIYFAPHDALYARLTPLVRDRIYRPYLAELSTAREEVERIVGLAEMRPLRIRRSGFAGVKARLVRIRQYAMLVLNGHAIRVTLK
jgi:hypothetical protein